MPKKDVIKPIDPRIKMKWIFDPAPFHLPHHLVEGLDKQQWIKLHEMEIELQKKELEIQSQRIQGYKKL